MDCDNPKVYLILRCFFFFRNAKEGQYQEYCDKKWGRTWEWCGGWWDWELACTTFPFVVVDPVPPLGHEPPFPICHMCIHPPAHWSATNLQFYTPKDITYTVLWQPEIAVPFSSLDKVRFSVVQKQVCAVWPLLSVLGHTRHSSWGATLQDTAASRNIRWVGAQRYSIMTRRRREGEGEWLSS